MLLSTQIERTRESLDRIIKLEMQKYPELMKVEDIYEYVQFLKAEPTTEDNAALKEEMTDLEHRGVMP